MLENRNIFIFEYITKNKQVFNILKKYFESKDIKVSTEYIETLISNNNISKIRKILRKQYGPIQLNTELAQNNTFEIKLLCPTFCHIQSIEKMKKNKNIFILKNKDKYELIVYNYGSVRKTIKRYLSSYETLKKSRKI